MTHHAPRQKVTDLIASFHEHLGRNISIFSNDAIPLFNEIDLNSRIIDEIRATLIKNYCVTNYQKDICSDILDEVFTDFTIALYLFAIGLIVPARMSVRRALEEGLAVVFMWDLPHEYWGWRQLDADLSYSNMVSHLNSASYLKYLANVHGCHDIDVICDSVRFQRFYRKLSNTVHGKVEGLPPLSPERFSADKNGISKHLKLTMDVQKAIIDLLYGRFHGLKADIEKAFPQVGR
ncbi:hypothetical protein F6V30_09245 [Oryzomonas sagensis]|uniref:Uncharacterized protein n=1 Tax=Oryzomonas sagensis TaxID=2603857 RepID=A0ABQ6TNW9_9BACT|nr:hypothetical protein [Oryzomonas sagensis]KAB0670328.1 hypothetical protein F6V30_09245 [Oryzomonas sagensis]